MNGANGQRPGPVWDENGWIVRNANGDLIPQDQAQVFHCDTCRRWLGETGERVPYDEDAEVIVWVECGRCREKRELQEAEEEERRRREEERRRPRECALEGCGELFTPRTAWQAYCTDEHRWKAHRLLKAQRAAAAV